MSTVPLDETDHMILRILREDARRSFVEIGRAVNLSEAAVRRRVKQLVDSAVIKRFTIEAEMGQGARALTLISVHPATPTPRVSDTLRKVNGVEVVYEITGQYDIAVILSAVSIAEINRCIDDIRRVEGVATTNTIVILRVIR